MIEEINLISLTFYIHKNIIRIIKIFFISRHSILQNILHKLKLLDIIDGP